MEITFLGVRGSIPAPGPNTVRYGGNTTCVGIRTDDGDVIIIDGGSGIRQHGLDLLAELPVHCSIFITHTHWIIFRDCRFLPHCLFQATK